MVGTLRMRKSAKFLKKEEEGALLAILGWKMLLHTLSHDPQVNSALPELTGP